MLRRILETAKMNDEKTISNEEYQYLGLIKDILTEGVMENGRNGNAKTIFGAAMHFSLKDNTIPFITTKRLAWKTCFKELMWFIKGQTDNSILQEQKVTIWNGNGSKDFLEKQGLGHYLENDLGPVYGHQWRSFNAEYKTCKEDYTGKGVDQLKYIIDNLKNPETRNSRRLVMSAWNPCQIKEMALPPCHVLAQFNVVEGNKLSCSLYQRSGDVGLGVPFNIASYSFLTHLIAKHCKLEATELIHYLGNCHIYENHIEQLKIQIKREPFDFPKINFLNIKENIEDYTLDDIEIVDYKYHENINMVMIP